MYEQKDKTTADAVVIKVVQPMILVDNKEEAINAVRSYCQQLSQQFDQRIRPSLRY